MNDTAVSLTPKQEAFARAYVETGNASEAYRRAYDAENMGVDAVKSEAFKLMQHPYITLTIEKLQEQHKKRHEITVDALTEMLRDDRVLARDEKDPAAAINAVMAIAKLHGLVIDKKNVNSDNRHHHSAEPLSPFAQHLAEVLGAGAKGEAEGTLPN